MCTVTALLLLALLDRASSQNLFSFNGLGEDEQFVEDTAEFREEYDFVVVGAGSGGCVVTNRLTEMPDWTVLLLEAGGDENFVTDFPLGSLLPGLFAYSWNYKTEQMKTACLGQDDGRCNWPRGRIMGGCSTINLMAHSRGNRLDFDDWEAEGNAGWKYKDVLKYFVKSEKAAGPLSKDIDEGYHGSDGYLSLEYAKYSTPLLRQFLLAAEEFGYNVTDPNGKGQLGFSHVQLQMRNGRRCSASKAYVRPVRRRPNLFVSKHTRATKILIDPRTKRARGVEFVKNFRKYRVRVRKEVIVSAGTMNSPQLLMLSGVGPEEHLKSLNITVVNDLKVGYNLQDHMSFLGLTFMVNDSVTIRTSTLLSMRNALDYVINSAGPYTMPGGAEAIAFMKTPISKTREGYPDIEVVLGSGGLNTDIGPIGRRIIGLPEEFYQKVFADVKNREAFSLVPVVMRKPNSRGRIMLKSKDPFHWPLMYANFFEDEEDLHAVVEGVRMVRRK